jgi:hypothetical protein
MTTQNVEYSFFFRAEKTKDADGKEIGESKKLPAFKSNLPIPSVEDLMGYLAVGDSAEAKLIVELIGDAIYQVARQQINDWRENNKDATEVSPAALDLAKLDFSVIATTPRESVGRAGVSEEQWTAFYESYAQVMLASGEQANRVQTQVAVITNKFKSVKDVKVLERMQEKLNLFAASAGEEVLAEHARAFLLTVNRLEAAVKKASETSLDDIG